MELFRVEVHPRVIKTAQNMLKPAHIKKLAKFLEVAKYNPIPKGFDIKPLKNFEVEGYKGYRLRIGNYRLLYGINWKDKIVYISKLEPRERAYK
jgi:mRNA interferase RelE/StbE